MAKFNAFIARSFDPADEKLVHLFYKHFDAFKQLGFDYEDAEDSTSASVASKVKAKLEGKNVFVGIFTQKNQLKEKTYISRILNSILNKTPNWTTSTWSLQESGYAIAKNMKLILLVEKSIIEIGGLHGDHEYISFSRENPEICFQKLTEQINELIAGELPREISGITMQTEDALTVSSEITSEEIENEPDLYDQVVAQLLEKKDDDAFSLCCKWVEQSESENEKNEKLARYYKLRHDFGIHDALKAVERFVTEHPDCYLGLFNYGQVLKSLSENKTAINFLQKALELATNNDEKLNTYQALIETLIADERIDDAAEIIKNKLSSCCAGDDLRYLTNLWYSKIFEKQKIVHQEIAFIEKAISIRHSDTDLRFKLAYKYSELGFDAMALHHYKLIEEITNSSGAGSLNNIGVAYTRLDLESKSIEFYKKAAEKGNEKAIGNLALRYASAGFIDDAEAIIGNALKKPTNEINVYKAKEKVEERKKKEKDREVELLDQARKQSDFRIAFASATNNELQKYEQLDGVWETPAGQVSMKFTANKFTGKNYVQSEETSLTLDVSFIGSAGFGYFEIEKKAGLFSTFLSSGNTTKKYDVYLLILSSNKIRVMEIAKDNTLNFHEYSR